MQKGSTKFFAYFRPSEPKLGIDEPQWDFDRPDESLEKLYQYTVEFARGKVRFYYEDAEKNRKLSTIFRAAALIALTIGGMLPLIEAAGSLGDSHLSRWGYVTLALGAAMIYADQLFVSSASWVRSTVTWLLLRRSLEDFQYDWITLRTKAREAQLSEEQSTSRMPVSALLEKLKRFRSEIETHIADETKVWSDEIVKALYELRKRSAAQAH